MLEGPRVTGFLWILVICVLVPGALWYLAVRRHRPRLKVWAAAVELAALIVLRIDLGQTQCGRFVPTRPPPLDRPGARGRLRSRAGGRIPSTPANQARGPCCNS